MKRRAMTLLLLAFFAFVPPILGAEQVLTLEPETTEVTFFLKATGHDVEGHLYLQAGRISFDPDTGIASGEIRIDAARADTGNDKRDKKLHKSVLVSEEYPLILFKPQRLEGELAASGASQLALVGTVSIIGSEHPLTLPATIELEDGRLTAETTFKVPYVEWGLKDPSILFLSVAKEVEVSITATGSIETAAADAAVASR